MPLGYSTLRFKDSESGDFPVPCALRFSVVNFLFHSGLPEFQMGKAIGSDQYV